jgi:dUTP pyrophosphatase
MRINFKRLKDSATIPTLNNDTDAGVDLYSCEDLIIPAFSHSVIKTGIAWEPKNISTGKKAVMIVKSRSGLAFKYDIECTNAGVVDQEYRGEIGVKLYNNSKHRYAISEGDRIAQGVIKELPNITIHEVKELSETNRGVNGFGSSGK